MDFSTHVKAQYLTLGESLTVGDATVTCIPMFRVDTATLQECGLTRQNIEIMVYIRDTDRDALPPNTRFTLRSLDYVVVARVNADYQQLILFCREAT